MWMSGASATSSPSNGDSMNKKTHTNKYALHQVYYYNKYKKMVVDKYIVLYLIVIT